MGGQKYGCDKSKVDPTGTLLRASGRTDIEDTAAKGDEKIVPTGRSLVEKCSGPFRPETTGQLGHGNSQ